MKKLLIITLTLMSLASFAQNATPYQTPPKEIYDLVMALPNPSASIDNAGKWMVLMQRNPFQTVAQLAEPELRIAGMRFNPNNYGPSRMTTIANIRLIEIATLKEVPVTGLPTPLQATGFQWNPAQTKMAFLNLTPTKIDLYVLDIATASVSKINTAAVNAVSGGGFTWVDDNNLLVKTVADNLKKPAATNVPTGPVVQESVAKKAAGRTFQDLIKSPFDEELFAYYANSQLVINNLSSETKIGQPAIYRSFSVSPDKKYILTQIIDKPFSYSIPAYGFPHRVIVTDIKGNLVREIAKNPSAEGDPIGFDDAPEYPRFFDWRDDEPSTVTYLQALDGGIGKSKAAYRDALMAIKISETETNAPATELFKTRMRFGGITWGNATTALFTEDYNATRKFQMNRYNPTTGKVDSVYARSLNDSYADMGDPVTVKNSFGKNVLYIKGNEVMFSGDGASNLGDMPVLQTFDLATGKKKVLWQCQSPNYEYPVKIIDPATPTFITSKESKTEAPNYFLYTTIKKKPVVKQLTQFTNPYKGLEGVTKQKIEYTRTDGVKLSADLYLPNGFKPGTDKPLPVFMWAYPIEYKSVADASQVRGSKNLFIRPNYGSPIFWVTRGYAVLDNAEMPIVGVDGKEPNDSFIPQLYLNAHAAIQKLAQMGVGDSTRVGVGGHSYGAFMTANLLAHTNLFKAGIARSGAYNRTLTPFGFQGEERTYWEAPEIYNQMSPFSYADKIKTPILLIHGELDNNTGTFPIQSERLYAAIKGHGGTVRFVTLPFESHGYSAKENILHMLWEMDEWLDKYVKNGK